MKVIRIPNNQSGVLSKIMEDYQSESSDLEPFCSGWQTKKDLLNQVSRKKNAPINREVLVTELHKQYAQVSDIHESVLYNIDQLKNENSFTVVTGHQLSLFTGPLYFLYKIVSVINMTKKLNQEVKENHFVPVFWMATEDHDFEEISSFLFEDKKLTWEREINGAVGKMSTIGLESVFKELETLLPTSNNSQNLLELFKNSYLKNKNLAEATRVLVNNLFGNFGLVIIDGDVHELKKLFIPFITEEIIESKAADYVSEQSEKLAKKYHSQAYTREINLFYLSHGARNRIERIDDHFQVVDTDIQFSENEILEEINNHPENFSPNVIYRPLYQEVILPNIAYVGGGGELAYWLQLKSNFERLNIPFPILWLRNSAGFLTKSGVHHLRKLTIETADVFKSKDAAIRKLVEGQSPIGLDLTKYKDQLDKVFTELSTLAEKTDSSMKNAVLAEGKRHEKAIDRLERKLLRAEKRSHSEALQHLSAVQDFLKPNGTPQERVMNLSTAYMSFGPQFIEDLLDNLDPFEKSYTLFLEE